MRARVNFGSDGTKHVDILCRWGHNVKLHPDYIQTYNHGEYSVVLPVYGTQYCNVFVFSTKKEVDSLQGNFRKATLTLLSQLVQSRGKWKYWIFVSPKVYKTVNLPSNIPLYRIQELGNAMLL